MSKKKRAQLRTQPTAPVFIASASASHSLPLPDAPSPAGDYDLTTAVLIALKRVLYGEQSRRPLTQSLRQAYHNHEE